MPDNTRRLYVLDVDRGRVIQKLPCFFGVMTSWSPRSRWLVASITPDNAQTPNEMKLISTQTGQIRSLGKGYMRAYWTSERCVYAGKWIKAGKAQSVQDLSTMGTEWRRPWKPGLVSVVIDAFDPVTGKKRRASHAEALRALIGNLPKGTIIPPPQLWDPFSLAPSQYGNGGLVWHSWDRSGKVGTNVVQDRVVDSTGEYFVKVRSSMEGIGASGMYMGNGIVAYQGPNMTAFAPPSNYTQLVLGLYDLRQSRWVRFWRYVTEQYGVGIRWEW